MKENRVVITGLGVVSPVGIGVEPFWRALLAGRNGISRVSHFEASSFSTKLAAEVKDFNAEEWLDRKAVGRTERFAQFGQAAAELALQDAGLHSFPYDHYRIGVIVGSGIGGSQTIEEGHRKLLSKGPNSMHPLFVSKLLINMAACNISIKYGLKGPISAPSMACSTGANAVGDAFRIIQRGDADLMLAGGAEAAIAPLAYGGFCASRSMSQNEDPACACRPFDKNRDGFVMGEGAGIVVLENLEHALNRGVRIYAELVGYGNTADAYHLVAPDPDGDGMYRVMRNALADAGLAPEMIGYINAHGSSTELNDKVESAAIIKLFGEHAKKLKVSSIKSMIGHLLAAAGAVELIATTMSVYTNCLPPTINYREPDPECPLDYVTGGMEQINLNVALNNSFGFGGGNACLAIAKYGKRHENTQA